MFWNLCEGNLETKIVHKEDDLPKVGIPGLAHAVRDSYFGLKSCVSDHQTTQNQKKVKLVSIPKEFFSGCDNFLSFFHCLQNRCVALEVFFVDQFNMVSVMNRDRTEVAARNVYMFDDFMTLNPLTPLLF